MRFLLLLVCLATLVSAETAIGQVMVDENRPEFIFSGSSKAQSGGTRIDNLLADASVIDQLGLVAGQKEKLGQLVIEIGIANKKASDEYLEAGIGVRSGLERDAARKKYQQALEQNLLVFDAAAKRELLPQQLERLDEIATLKTLERDGMEGLFSTAEGGANGDLFSKLSPDERNRISKKVAEIRAKLKRDIEALKLKAVDDILSELPAECEAGLRKKIGLSFSQTTAESKRQK